MHQPAYAGRSPIGISVAYEFSVPYVHDFPRSFHRRARRGRMARRLWRARGCGHGPALSPHRGKLDGRRGPVLQCRHARCRRHARRRRVPLPLFHRRHSAGSGALEEGGGKAPLAVAPLPEGPGPLLRLPCLDGRKPSPHRTRRRSARRAAPAGPAADADGPDRGYAVHRLQGVRPRASPFKRTACRRWATSARTACP